MPNTFTYLAIVERIPGREFRAHFPDFPEVSASDATIDGVRVRAGEALGARITQLLQANERVPQPRSVDDVKETGLYRHGFLLEIEAEVPESRL